MPNYVTYSGRPTAEQVDAAMAAVKVGDVLVGMDSIGAVRFVKVARKTKQQLIVHELEKGYINPQRLLEDDEVDSVASRQRRVADGGFCVAPMTPHALREPCKEWTLKYMFRSRGKYVIIAFGPWACGGDLNCDFRTWDGVPVEEKLDAMD